MTWKLETGTDLDCDENNTGVSRTAAGGGGRRQRAQCRYRPRMTIKNNFIHRCRNNLKVEALWPYSVYAIMFNADGVSDTVFATLLAPTENVLAE